MTEAATASTTVDQQEEDAMEQTGGATALKEPPEQASEEKTTEIAAKDSQIEQKAANTTGEAPKGKSEEKAPIKRKKRASDRKWRWKKPIDKPKRPLSAYNLFFKEERARIMDENAKQSKAVGFTEMARMVGAKWNNLPSEEKKVFEEQAAKAKEIYFVEVAEWKEKQKQAKKEQEQQELLKKRQSEEAAKQTAGGKKKSVGKDPAESSVSSRSVELKHDDDPRLLQQQQLSGLQALGAAAAVGHSRALPHPDDLLRHRHLAAAEQSYAAAAALRAGGDRSALLERLMMTSPTAAGQMGAFADLPVPAAAAGTRRLGGFPYDQDPLLASSRAALLERSLLMNEQEERLRMMQLQQQQQQQRQQQLFQSAGGYPGVGPLGGAAGASAAGLSPEELFLSSSPSVLENPAYLSRLGAIQQEQQELAAMERLLQGRGGEAPLSAEERLRLMRLMEMRRRNL